MSAAANFNYITDNIIIGNGEVPAVKTREGLKWMLPGGKFTTDRTEAVSIASQLDRIVSANLRKFKRRLMQQ